MIIRELDSLTQEVEDAVSLEFDRFAQRHEVDVNFTPFAFAAEEDGQTIGYITGHAFYNEVHISDLILLENSRKKGAGTKLMQAVEDHFRGRGFGFLAVTTYEFQAPGFYIKNGYQIEHIRKDPSNPKLDKYYFIKKY